MQTKILINTCVAPWCVWPTLHFFSELNRSCLCYIFVTFAHCQRLLHGEQWRLAWRNRMQALEFWGFYLGILHHINVESLVNDSRKVNVFCLHFLHWFLTCWIHQELFFSRYIEIVHTIWHKTHFKISWIYKMMIASWVGGYVHGFFYTVVPNKVSLFWPLFTRESVKKSSDVYFHWFLFFAGYWAFLHFWNLALARGWLEPTIGNSQLYFDLDYSLGNYGVLLWENFVEVNKDF